MIRNVAIAPRSGADGKLTGLELLIVFIVAVPLLGAFFPYESYLSAQTFANPLGAPVEIGKSTTICLVVLYGLIIWLYARQMRMTLPFLLENWQLLLFTAWTLTTALWSEAASQSFNRSGRILLCVLFGVYIARAFDRRVVFKIMCYAILIGLACSALVTVVDPALSRMIDARVAWRGAYQHKNVLGSISAFAILFGLLSWSTRSVSRYVCVALCLGGAVFLVMSNSFTSVVAFAVALLFVTLLRLFAPRPDSARVIVTLAALLMIGAGALLIAADPSIVEVAGRDLTLTGRTEIWAFAQKMIELKPLFGWGHGVWSTESFHEFALETLGWGAPAAHNTWVDFRLQLGSIGYGLACFLALVAVKRAIMAVLNASHPEYLVWVAVLIFEGIRSNTETMFLDPGTPETLWFALTFARLSALSRTQDVRQAVVPPSLAASLPLSRPALAHHLDRMGRL